MRTMIMSCGRIGRRNGDAMVTMDAAQLVVAAQGGDSRALESLVAGHLSLVYNVAGRALNAPADVDDVVQETMLRVVTDLPALRTPGSFRSWLVAITLRQVSERVRRRTILARRTSPLDEAPELPDAGADFAEATVLRLGLSGQRRQVAEAVRWLDADDRGLLSLWWLEVGGRLSRAEVAAGIGRTVAHTNVSILRMRGQLDLARTIVSALSAVPRCAGLAETLAGWDGRPSPRWRKRIARHVRGCDACGGSPAALIPPERLLGGLALVPVPAGLASAVSGKIVVGVAGGGSAAAGSGAAAAKAGSLGWLAKSAAVVAVGATATGAIYLSRPAHHPAPRPSQAVVAAPARSPASPSPATSAAPSPSPTTKAAVYGSVVDGVDRAPSRTRKPASLPHRPEGTLKVIASVDANPASDLYSLVHRGESVTFRGRGYLVVPWQIAYAQRIGTVAPPSWTGLRGKLFHVASGGGRRLDDPVPAGPAGATFMGTAATGFTVLPSGAQQMWQNEYFYLDGEVTLHQNERGADYNLYPALTTWRAIHADLGTAPSTNGAIRYGLTRDDGTDACPVPQYLTRKNPADPTTVRQQSYVR
jgi:RNA polymerase sigma factor (sigma-70 family)